MSTPPLAVPPLSISRTVTVATPSWPAAAVKVSVPFGLIAGCAEKSTLLLLVTRNVKVWPDSSGGYIGDLGQQGVVTVAFQQSALEAVRHR